MCAPSHTYALHESQNPKTAKFFHGDRQVRDAVTAPQVRVGFTQVNRFTLFQRQSDRVASVCAGLFLFCVFRCVPLARSYHASEPHGWTAHAHTRTRTLKHSYSISNKYTIARPGLFTSARFCCTITRTWRADSTAHFNPPPSGTRVIALISISNQRLGEG